MGILSGMCLAAINGIKGMKYNVKKDYNTINKINSGLMILHDTYSDIYHKTYHGKKEKNGFYHIFGYRKDNLWRI